MQPNVYIDQSVTHKECTPCISTSPAIKYFHEKDFSAPSFLKFIRKGNLPANFDLMLDQQRFLTDFIPKARPSTVKIYFILYSLLLDESRQFVDISAVKIAKLSNLSVRSVFYALKALHDNNFIVRSRPRPSKCNRYQVQGRNEENPGIVLAGEMKITAPPLVLPKSKMEKVQDKVVQVFPTIDGIREGAGRTDGDLSTSPRSIIEAQGRLSRPEASGILNHKYSTPLNFGYPAFRPWDEDWMRENPNYFD